MPRSTGRAAPLALLLCLAAVARAEEAPPDYLELQRDAATDIRIPLPCRAAITAGRAEGELLHLRPGDYAYLLLPSGEACVFPWTAIAGAGGPSFRGLHEPPLPDDPRYEPRALPGLRTARNEAHLVLVPADPSIRAAYLTPRVGAARLRLESAGAPLTITVPRRAGYLGEGVLALGTTLCQTPCTLHLPAGQTVVQASSARTPSAALELMVPPQGLAVRLREGSRLRTRLGAGLLAAGGGLTVMGVAALALAPLVDAGHRLGPTVAGAVALSTGVALLVPGIVLLRSGRGGIERRGPLGLTLAPLPAGALLSLQL